MAASFESTQLEHRLDMWCSQANQVKKNHFDSFSKKLSYKDRFSEFLNEVLSNTSLGFKLGDYKLKPKVCG